MKQVVKKFIATTLLSLTLFGQLAPVAYADCMGGTTLGVPTCDLGLNPKEDGLFGISWDGILYIIKEAVLQVIIQQIKSWAANGFYGSPYFVENAESFFQGVAQEASGAFIDELAQNTGIDLCSDLLPRFVIDTGSIGRTDYYRRARCTINDVRRRYESFNVGGWRQYIEVQSYGNNPYDLYIASVDEAARRESVAKDVFEHERQTGGGFLPAPKCAERVPDPAASDPGFVGPPRQGACKKWVISTPAKAISDQINSYIGSSIGNIIPADEMTEIVSAVITGLVRRGLDELSSN